MDTDPLWTARSLVDNAEAVRRVHRDFLTAGARIVLTCSYQVSVDLFKEELGISRAQTREHIGRDAQTVLYFNRGRTASRYVSFFLSFYLLMRNW